MARPRKTRTLDVRMNGELVGHWTLAKGGIHELRYAEPWLGSPNARPLSLSLRLDPVPHRGAAVEHYFDNLLPDSQAIRERAQARFGAASTRAFDLLAEIGRDCVGAVQLVREGTEPPPVRVIEADPLTEAEVAEQLRRAAPLPGQDRAQHDSFRLSLAGAQEKTAFLKHDQEWCAPRGSTPTSHIFKQPLGQVALGLDLSTSVENEWLCTQLLDALGLPTAPCELGQFEDQRVLIVERFDRMLAPNGSWWLRLPQEDLCQATGTPAALKYESDGGPGIESILSLLLGSLEAHKDRRTFFTAQVTFWMLCAIDGHAKNFSLALHPHGRFQLTPLYDVISTYPVLGHGGGKLSPHVARMAMAVQGKNRHYEWSRILPRHWRTMAAKCGLGAEIDNILGELARAAPRAVETVHRRLPAGFPAAVAEPVLEGLAQAATKLGA